MCVDRNTACTRQRVYWQNSRIGEQLPGKRPKKLTHTALLVVGAVKEHSPDGIGCRWLAVVLHDYFGHAWRIRAGCSTQVVASGDIRIGETNRVAFGWPG